MEFSTTVKADVYNINALLGISKDVDVETDSADMIVKWTADVDFREFGINGISWTILSVTGSVTWSVANDDLKEADIEQIKAAGGIEYRNERWEGTFDLPQDWAIKDDMEMNDHCLSPETLTIDCKDKEITVE